MRDLADQKHPRADDLRAAADTMDVAANGFLNALPKTHTFAQMFGAWAHARRLWCECTGEPLI